MGKHIDRGPMDFIISKMHFSLIIIKLTLNSFDSFWVISFSTDILSW